jgi:hypothetical protein
MPVAPEGVLYPSGRRILVRPDGSLAGAADGDIWFLETEKKVADLLLVQHHYSHKVTKNSLLSFSVCGGKGAIQLGVGIRPKSKGKLAHLCLTREVWCEFDRMWLSDDLPKFSESRIIGLLLFYLKRRLPALRLIITYADESAGNTGVIYQATNAVEVGRTFVEFYLLPDGERLHPVSCWHRHKTRNWEFMKAQYPGVIHITQGRAVGDATVAQDRLAGLTGKRQRQYAYGLDRRTRQELEKLRIS